MHFKLIDIHIQIAKSNVKPSGNGKVFEKSTALAPSLRFH